MPLARKIPRSLLSPSSPSAATLSRPTTILTRTSRSAITPIRQQRRAASDHAHEGEHGDHGHESHYDQPGGWLWGIRPGEKYEKEGWENLMWYGFAGSWIVAVCVYAGKEDTSIQTWALEEARRRLEKEGILEDPSEGRILEESKK